MSLCCQRSGLGAQTRAAACTLVWGLAATYETIKIVFSVRQPSRIHCAQQSQRGVHPSLGVSSRACKEAQRQWNSKQSQSCTRHTSDTYPIPCYSGTIHSLLGTAEASTVLRVEQFLPHPLPLPQNTMADDSLRIRPEIDQPVSMAQYYNRPPSPRSCLIPRNSQEEPSFQPVPALRPDSPPARRMLHHHNIPDLSKAPDSPTRPVERKQSSVSSSSMASLNSETEPAQPAAGTEPEAAGGGSSDVSLRPITPPPVRMAHAQNISPLPPAVASQGKGKKGCTVS